MVGYFCSMLCGAALTIGAPDQQTGISPVTLRAVYVDDTAPHPCGLIADSVARGWPLVIAGVSELHPSARCANVTSPAVVYALDWYPYGARAYVHGPPPCGHQAYILQARYQNPTARQAAGELAAARACDPALIFEY